MSTPTFIVFLAMLFIGVPSALRLTGLKVRVRNATALAIMAMWFVGQAIYASSGECMPLAAMLLQDMVVIVAIFTKPDWRDCSPYRTFRQQLRGAWLERSPWDRAIIALFPLAWLFYAPVVDAWLQYWTLYGIGLAQLMLAGWEALTPLLRTIGQSPRADDERPPGLRFAAWERVGV